MQLSNKTLILSAYPCKMEIVCYVWKILVTPMTHLLYILTLHQLHLIFHVFHNLHRTPQLPFDRLGIYDLFTMKFFTTRIISLVNIQRKGLIVKTLKYTLCYRLFQVCREVSLADYIQWVCK